MHGVLRTGARVPLQFVDGIQDCLPYRCERIVCGARSEHGRDEFVTRNCVAIVQASEQLSREPERRTFHITGFDEAVSPSFSPLPSAVPMRLRARVCRKYGATYVFLGVIFHL
jgi:hypothetical protein